MLGLGDRMFHGHRWMKCYPGTSHMAITESCELKTDVPSASMDEVYYSSISPMAITECCDLETDATWASMNEVLRRDQPYGHYWMSWVEDRCSMGIDEWSTTPALVMAITECCDLDRCSMGIDEWSAIQGAALWPLLNVVTWRQMLHGHWWIKWYPWPGTSSSPTAIHYWILWVRIKTECSMGIDDWTATQGLVLWSSLNVTWQGDRCSMGIDEWISANQGSVLWPYWKLWVEDRCSMGIDGWSMTSALVLWPSLNVVSWRQMFHGHRWMKYNPITSSMAITECCELKRGVPWASMNEVQPQH
jgi:hypothetical protein